MFARSSERSTGSSSSSSGTRTSSATCSSSESSRRTSATPRRRARSGVSDPHRAREPERGRCGRGRRGHPLARGSRGRRHRGGRPRDRVRDSERDARAEGTTPGNRRADRRPLLPPRRPRRAPRRPAAPARRRRPLPPGGRGGMARPARPRPPPSPRLRPRAGHGSPRIRAPLVAQRTPAVFQSFNYAFEGVIHALRTQRNMRIHFAVAAAVLVLAFIYDVTRLELSALMIAIAFVLIAEMVNTAVEATIDLSTPSFDPLAKIAKDLAAGAVLIASVNAIAVGYLVLADRLKRPSARLVNELGDAPVNLTVIALVLTLIIVIAVKAATGRGTPLRGGLPSGHAALAFGGWTAITFITVEHRIVVSFVALIMALLVAQTRVEAGVHTTFEVVLGAVIGTLVTLILFQIFR